MAKHNKENEPPLTEAHQEFLKEFNNRGGFEGIEEELNRHREPQAVITQLQEQITTLKADLAKQEEQLESIIIVYAKKCEDDEGSYYEVGEIVTDSFDEAVSLIPKDIEKKKADLAKAEGQLIKAEAEFSFATGYSDKLEKQLKRHGGHTADCAYREPYITKSGAMEEVPKCDCGWAEIEKGQ